MNRFSIVFTLLLLPVVACGQKPARTPQEVGDTAQISLAGFPSATDKVQKSEAEWKKTLTPEEYSVLREAGTESPGTGSLLHNHRSGVYVCAACGNPLFSSQTKFESGTGWPSFYQPIERGRVLEKEDNTIGMSRTEVLCARCGSHLGHVFEDGPKPTGLRYCMNSVALKFIPVKQ